MNHIDEMILRCSSALQIRKEEVKDLLNEYHNYLLEQHNLNWISIFENIPYSSYCILKTNNEKYLCFDFSGANDNDILHFCNENNVTHWRLIS